MIGKNRSIRINDFIENKVESIRKVDIDFFSNGDREGAAYKYKIDFYKTCAMISLVENNTADLRFKVKPGSLQITDVVLDEGISLGYAQTSSSDWTIYIPKISGGLHVLLVRLKNKNDEYSIESTTFYVTPIGETKVVGKHIPIVDYRKALLNVTKLWLLSRSYDRIRKPDWAGFFDRLLREYPMNDAGAESIEHRLLEELQEKIPNVVISSVKAVPDLANKGWNVSVKAFDSETNITTEFDDTGDTFVTIQDKITPQSL